MLQMGGRGLQRMAKSTSLSTGECKSDRPTSVKFLHTISLVKGGADEAGNGVSGGDAYERGDGTWRTLDRWTEAYNAGRSMVRDQCRRRG